MKYPAFVVVNQQNLPLYICESDDEAIKVVGLFALRAVKNGSADMFRVIIVDPPEKM